MLHACNTRVTCMSHKHLCMIWCTRVFFIHMFTRLSLQHSYIVINHIATLCNQLHKFCHKLYATSYYVCMRLWFLPSRLDFTLILTHLLQLQVTGHAILLPKFHNPLLMCCQLLQYVPIIILLLVLIQAHLQNGYYTSNNALCRNNGLAYLWSGHVRLILYFLIERQRHCLQTKNYSRLHPNHVAGDQPR